MALRHNLVEPFLFYFYSITELHVAVILWGLPGKQNESISIVIDKYGIATQLAPKLCAFSLIH